MLKKFKQWFSYEEVDSLRRPEHSGNLANRARLEQETVQLSKGFFLKATIGSVSDIPDILEIEALCYEGKTPWDKKALEHEIKSNNRAIYLIVRESTKAVGFIGAWLVDKETHITNVAVIPDYQKRGIATFLIAELQKISEQENIKKMSLEVRISNENAQRLYNTLGFQKGIIKKDYYTGDKEDALEMNKFI